MTNHPCEVLLETDMIVAKLLRRVDLVDALDENLTDGIDDVGVHVARLLEHRVGLSAVVTRSCRVELHESVNVLVERLGRECTAKKLLDERLLLLVSLLRAKSAKLQGDTRERVLHTARRR